MTRAVKIAKAGKAVKTDSGYAIELVDIIANDQTAYKRCCKKMGYLELDYEPVEQVRKISDEAFLQHSEIVTECSN